MRKKLLNIISKEKLSSSRTGSSKKKGAAKTTNSASKTGLLVQTSGGGVSDADEPPPRPVKRPKLEKNAEDNGNQSVTSHPKGYASKKKGKDVKAWGCHSVVQRQAATAVKKLLAAQASGRHGTSVKSLTLAPHIQAKKATFKVTCQTLKALYLLKRILANCHLLARHEKLSESLACVLCCELLLGEGVRPHGPAERAVLAAEGELRAAAEGLAAEAGVDDLAELLEGNSGAQHPRAARVNLLKMEVNSAVKHLKDPNKPGWQEAFREVQRDSLLPDVLSFPAGTDLHNHPLVIDGSIILQSRASCMPAHALDPKPGQTVLDACAAPGNKTTHLAALMGNKGRIEALDRDAKRLERLKGNAKATAVSIIHARCQDFLETDPNLPEFCGVEAMLLDPSCSGSGTAISRLDHLLPKLERLPEETSEKEAGRIAALADFQTRAVLHALTFPNLRRLVYSTCSVHKEENELVVAAVLAEAKSRGFALYDPFPGWARRGLPLCPGSHLLIRTDPQKDGTDGFFVAAFART